MGGAGGGGGGCLIEDQAKAMQSPRTFQPKLYLPVISRIIEVRAVMAKLERFFHNHIKKKLLPSCGLKNYIENLI